MDTPRAFFPLPAGEGARAQRGQERDLSRRDARKRERRKRSYSAAFGTPAAAALAAASAAALRSTKRTDQIEPSNSAINGTASESWLITSGGVSTAAMTNAPTMK